jgi:uncharacterized membrane-anchored protein
MGWREKELQKYQARKLALAAMNTREYQETRKKEEEEIAVNTYVRFCLVACDYLQINFRCKRKGIIKFLKYAASIMKYISYEDDKYFVDMNQVMIDECGVDVLAELGARVKKDDKG